MSKTKTITVDGLLWFPKTTVILFRHTNTHLRWGQAFHQFFKLEKITDPKNKDFCDRLYYESNKVKAKAMVASRTQTDQ